jgi:ubiquinone/menaquinone biosynthesis C-methylase UbiE
MVGLARQAAKANGVGDLMHVETGDVNELAFPDGAFDLAVAVGVMEWMPSVGGPLEEIYRVLRPGGWLIVNVDNARALHCLLDPRMSPLLGPLKRYTRRVAERLGVVAPLARPSRSSRTSFDGALQRAGFLKIASRTCGFGPMTLGGVHMLTDKAGVALHHVLQNMADRRIPLIRNGGETYLVLAQKRDGRGKE